ncbi:guanylate kinase isoform X2 [Lingula anatina]|uniref:guanylate kinase n=1 Tax=Lingula anatina TaxID=7574 RepID=A0A1S3JCF9_LINAN|nr:guanylate kinase isoform X2 [Lingula anatina]|eukprot:XP_013407876.1 guanylate kinase isoform X2 [Lingula anatina]
MVTNLRTGVKLATGIVRSLSSVAMQLRPVVFSGPSGSGKSTLVKRLMKEYEDCFAFSISHTTRKPRPGEQNGREYHFVTREEMEKAISNGEFVEHAEFSMNLYGTSKKAIEDVASTGRICILDIDLQGVKSIKKTNLNPRYVFVRPPNLQILEQRLKGRGTETDETLKKRLSTAQADLDYANQKGSYDHIIINDDLDIAYEKLKGILIEDIQKLRGGMEGY